MVEVVNRQRSRKIVTTPWVKRTKQMLDIMGITNCSVTIAFVSDHQIRDLNKQFRGIDKATDVLSFPADEGDGELGDIAISLQTAERQAKQNELSINGEIAQLILHGLLHLSGHDHETDNGEMNKLELHLRKKLKI